MVQYNLWNQSTSTKTIILWRLHDKFIEVVGTTVNNKRLCRANYNGQTKSAMHSHSTAGAFPSLSFYRPLDCRSKCLNETKEKDFFVSHFFFVNSLLWTLFYAYLINVMSIETTNIWVRCVFAAWLLRCCSISKLELIMSTKMTHFTHTRRTHNRSHHIFFSFFHWSNYDISK